MSDELYAKLHTLTPLDLKQLSRQQKLELIQRHRACGARNSNAILFLSTDLLAGGARGLSSSELYDVYEQTLIASLDCGKLDNAKTYLNLLEKRFGRKSVRVNYVRGLCLEAEGKYAEAKVLYEEHVRSEAPTDAFTVKRLAAMLKSEGKYKEAIHVLESEKHYTDAEGAKYSYLDIHRSNSTDVYHELSALYFLCGDVPKAMYYEEEALLFDIDNYVLHNRLGELAFISKDLHRSTVEYSQSLLLNPAENNSRAAYGLWLSANESLRAHASGTLKYDDERDLTQMQELREFAAQTLKRMYAGSTMTADLESFLSGEVAASKK